MIILNVTDVSSGPGPYGYPYESRLRLSDVVHVLRTDSGLVLTDENRRHYFNKAGEYTGTEVTLGQQPV